MKRIFYTLLIAIALFFKTILFIFINFFVVLLIFFKICLLQPEDLFYKLKLILKQ